MYSMCIGKVLLARRVSDAVFIVIDQGGYGGEKRTNNPPSDSG